MNVCNLDPANLKRIDEVVNSGLIELALIIPRKANFHRSASQSKLCRSPEMGEKLEAQWVVSRAPYTPKGTAICEAKPWKWFDSRSAARSFCKAKVAKSARYSYLIDRVIRGPMA